MGGRSSTTTAAPRDFGPIQLARHLGLQDWQFRKALERGLLPAADREGRWSTAAAEAAAGKVAEIVEAFGDRRPIGANKSAAWLAQRTGHEVLPADIDVLVDRGVLAAVDEFEGWPVYDIRHLDALDAEVVGDAVAARAQWMQDSLDGWAAARELGWRHSEFVQVVAERQLETGWFGRYHRGVITELAADESLNARLDADRLIGPDQAATRLKIRRVDWDYLVAAGLIAHREINVMPTGRYKTVKVPMFRTREVDELREHPAVDLEQVRATLPGRPSPLRELARRPTTRAAVIRSFVAELGQTWGVEVWAWYRNGPDRWHLDWDHNADREPTKQQVLAAIDADPAVRRYRDDLVLDTDQGAAVRWARAMLEPGVAVVLDTETCDLFGAICEIAVVDAHTGETLLDTLVRPGTPISPEAQWIHGITDDEVADAPTWPEVLPRLLEATAGRVVLAYNSDYDSQVIRSDCRRYDLDPAHLGRGDSWGCIMNTRSDWLGIRRWVALGGGHRARGDCLSALDVLRNLTTPPHR
ncbi:3'-5' exonuclease [Saccharopolyspora taberi]|uniref:Exonuclease domain-containing protein n=1 Tax=Saccharopolyspora taberi TaxID=60895 RepID=A0ABN3VGG6_9PSEU